MNPSKSRLARLTPWCALASLLVGVAVLGTRAVAQTTATSFSGQAIAVNLNDIHQPVPGPIVVADTGPLPGSGGSLSTSVGAQNFYNGDLTLQSASASTSGSGNTATSTSSVQSLSMMFMDANGGTDTLSFGSISANASATCGASGATTSGGSQVSGLVLNGQAVAVTGEVNQTIAFSGFTLVLNEQITSAGSLTVNAIHIMVPGCMDGVISTAHADIACSSCPVCVDPALGLGSAAGCTVLELTNAQVSVTGPAGGIFGDMCIGPNGTLSMSGDEFVTGTIRLSPGAKFSNSSHGTVHVQYNADLSAEIHDAYAAAANASAQPCTQTFAKLDGQNVTTITGNAGLNVICVQDVVIAGRQIHVTGPAGAKFIFNVSGKFVLTGGGAGPQIRASGGVQPKDILYNIMGTGPDVAFSGGGGGVDCCAAIVDGTLLAPYRKIALSPGLVNGEVISGMNISIVSGSSVTCPSCQ
ncbi:choice-of-anchor P family protein [Opitutus sp. GAS368]|uniref:choice-of-anchor P family protein n=1 Tax=Opitutus sp. GAS368 TaxID=1882749 RepID=UPI00087D04DD|nr:choice-of-anchor P family protein [Opitutus sp. GAS368]SDS42724.1 hypothetical protein SAMN05444173_2864 [Opitutus sp. GAS368]